MIGRVVVGHEIEASIGEGGMGVVYRARHVQLGKVRALKLLSPRLAHDQDFRERFENEWRLAAAIEHPNIVEVLDAGEADEHLYILMRLIEGADLAALVQEEGWLPARRVHGIVEQIGAALDAAHERGLVHRDVTPRNILVTADDHAYLADFGVARTTATRGMTRTGFFVGNLDYAAPEQIEGKPINGRVDIYALGGVVYTSLTGQTPYVRESEAQLMYAQLQDPPPIPSSVQPHLPGELNEVVAKAMAKSPDDRYGSCGELTAALAAAIGPNTDEASSESGKHSARPAATVVDAAPRTVIDDPSESRGDGSSKPPPGPRGKRRIPRKVVLLALAVVVLAAAGAAAVVGSSSGSIRPPSGTWTATKPRGAGIYSQLVYVQCNGRDNCYADGFGQTGTHYPQFLQKWNGKTWTSSNSPFGPNTQPTSVGLLDCLPNGFCVVPISGSSTLEIDSVTNGHWTNMPINPPVTAAFLTGAVESVACWSQTLCVAVGTIASDKATSASGVGLVWNGQLWRSTVIPHQGRDPIQYMNSISCASPTFCMGVGATATSSTTPAHAAVAARWDGTRWTALPAPGGTSLNDVVCLSTTSCIAVGANGHAALVVRWNGKSFVKEKTPLTGESFTINCSSSDLCMALQKPPANKPLGTVPVAIRWHGHWFRVTGYPARAADLSGASCYTNGCTVVGWARATPSKDGNDIAGAQASAALYDITNR